MLYQYLKNIFSLETNLAIELKLLSMLRRRNQTIKSKVMIMMGYLGAVVGAGFASGQEIVQFFVSYGVYGFKGVIIATILFAVCGGLLLHIAHLNQVSNYQNILKIIFGDRIGKTIDIALAVFLFLGLSTMLSASGAVFFEHLFLPKWLGIFLAYILILMFLFTGKSGLVFSYNLLVPIKITLMVLIAGYIILFANTDDVGFHTAFFRPLDQQSWGIAAILYVAYNFALAMVVLTEYQPLTTRKNAITGAVWGGLVLGFVLFLNFTAMSKYWPTVIHYEVPMLYVTGNVFGPVKLVYCLVLWVGILTTAFANAYGVAQRIAKSIGLRYELCLMLCATASLPVSMQSFSSLVGKIYPIFGLLGIFILGGLVYKCIKDIVCFLYYNICN